MFYSISLHALIYIFQFRQEFKMITDLGEDVSVNSLLETWPLWQKRILKYSHLEKAHRPKIRQLLVQIDGSQATDEGKGLHLVYLMPTFITTSYFHRNYSSTATLWVSYTKITERKIDIFCKGINYSYITWKDTYLMHVHIFRVLMTCLVSRRLFHLLNHV